MRFGFKVPIVQNKDNEVVGGHTRLRAATELGIEAVPCLVADDLSDAEIKAFRLADNKTAELASWDVTMLGAKLEALNKVNLNFSMEDFGFDSLDTA